MFNAKGFETRSSVFAQWRGCREFLLILLAIGVGQVLIVEFGGGVFRTPGWMRVLTRDVNDPFDLHGPGVRGGLNVIDLANRWSCAFIQTEDVGTVFADGSFTVEGRIDRADIRGCNLLIQ